MVHRGKKSEEAVRSSGINLKALAEKMHLSRNTLYAWFKEPQLSIDNMLRLSEHIGYGWLMDFPEIQKLVRTDIVEEDGADYGLKEEIKSSYQMLMRYTSVLEEVNELRKENQRLKDALNSLRWVKYGAVICCAVPS